MAEDVKDSGSKPETEGQPIPPVSEPKSAEQGSFDAAKLQSTLDSFSKKLEEVDKRSKALQGEKDRGIASTKKEVEELKRQIAEIEKLKSTGFEGDAAIEEFTFREDVRQLREQLQAFDKVQLQTAGNGMKLANPAAEVVARYGFKNDDVDANSLVQHYGGDPDRLDGELAKLTLQRQKSASSSAQAAAVQGKTSSPPTPEKIEAMWGELNGLYKEPSKNKAKIAALTAELKGAGEPVD